MKIHLQHQLRLNWPAALRRAGYAPWAGRTELSFVRPMSSGSRYPQFHIYIDQSSTDQQLILNLHLDQRAPTYVQHHAHSGEYDGEAVAQEAGRVKAVLESL